MYSKDFKLAVVSHHKEGYTQDATAIKFKVGTSTIERWTKEFDNTGSVRDVFDTSKRTFKKIDPARLKAVIKETPCLLLKDLALIFDCSSAAIHLAMKSAGITRKKR